MKILAIETSCDETAAAVVEGNEGRLEILSNVVVSQVDIFAAYGGVIPEVAARSHLEAILPVVRKALDDAGLTKDDIDCVAVTHTPGLLGSLLIGTLTARMLAILWGKPMMAVHHLKSHIYANWLSGEMPEFPLIALVVSGGHTQIIRMGEHNQFEVVGTTRDDAVGECFDKVAKVLGLPYPGGPSIVKVASSSRFTSLKPAAAPSPHAKCGSVRCSTSPRNSSKNFATLSGNYKLPKPKVDGLDFSFSGLKTAVLRAVQAELGVPISTPSFELAGKLTEEQKCDFAASFQETVCEILVEKMRMALEKYPGARSVVLAGGVSANERLRERFYKEFGEGKVYFPEVKFCGDNAAMVGAAAYFEVLSVVEATDPYKLNIMPRSAIE